jgi:hypothetical protein
VFLAFQKKSMVERMVTGGFFSLVKIIHIELSDEGREIIVLEKPRQNVIGKVA